MTDRFDPDHFANVGESFGFERLTVTVGGIQAEIILAAAVRQQVGVAYSIQAAGMEAISLVEPHLLAGF